MVNYLTSVLVGFIFLSFVKSFISSNDTSKKIKQKTFQKLIFIHSHTHCLNYILCVLSDRRPGTGPVIPVPLMCFSAEPTVWAQSFPSSSVAATTTSTVPEVVETRLQESAAQTVRSDRSNPLFNLLCHPSMSY